MTSFDPTLPKSAPAPEHIAALTGLRGVAALLVVFYHVSGGFLPQLELPSVALGKGYLAVDLFFLLSGFVMMHVYGATFAGRPGRSDLRTFLFARLARLYPLHLAILGLLVAVETAKLVLVALDPAIPNVSAFAGGRNGATFLLHLLMLHAAGLAEGPTWNGPAWSIGAEWLAYLGFPVLVWLLAVSGRITRVAIIAAAFATLAILSSGGSDLDVTYDGGLWRCLAEFTLGVLLYEVHARGRLAMLGHDVAAFAMLAVLFVSLEAGMPDLLVVPLFALLILALSRNTGGARAVFANRPALFLGTVSYSVYMVHIPLIEIANLVSRAISGVPLGAHLGAGASLAVLVLSPLPVIAAAALLHRWVELPGRTVMKRLFRVARPARPEETAAQAS